MAKKSAVAPRKKPLVRWSKWDWLLGTLSDAKVAKMAGCIESSARKRRLKLGVQTYRSKQCPKIVLCENCKTPVVKQAKFMRRCRHHYCSKACHNEAQRRRDLETLRYGKGWKNIRDEVRKRDQVCVVCGRTPSQNGAALHVHHLKPYRFQGTNQLENLIALCESCHHILESTTTKALDLIQINVSLEGSCLTIMLMGEILWHGSVLGVDSQTQSGLIHSKD